MGLIKEKKALKKKMKITSNIDFKNFLIFLVLSISLFLNVITLCTILKLLILDLPDLLKLNFQELEGSISLLESRLENNVKTPIEEIASPIVKKEENSIFDAYKKDPFQL